jgi:PKD repeat protein
MAGPIATARRSIVAGTVALLLGAGALVGSPMSTARADSAPLDPANPATPATVSADPLPTVQINGVAWAQVVVGDTVYVTGQFSTARPAGAAPGTQQVTRDNLLAYDIRTGVLISSFAPSLNAQGRAIAASPDGSRIYVGGDFTQADGQSRYGVAAYSTATGALVDTFRPAVGGTVRAIAATDSTVYLGGDFTAVAGTARNRLAAVSAADGSLLPWAPQPGTGPTSGNRNGSTATSNSVLALVVTGGGSQVVAGGRFYTMNGALSTGVSALDPVTGATRPFAIGQLITNQGVNSAVFSLVADGDTVYGTAYDFYGPGNLEGSFAVAAAGGTLKWANTCLGDTYSAFPMNGALYHATHAHDCGNIGSFPEQSPRVNMFGTAVSLAAAGTTGAANFGNGAFANKPAPRMQAWWPTFYSGTYTGQYQAGWTVSGNGQYVVYGGEFPGVNGSEQQGLVRFAVRELAPNKVSPRTTGTFAPTVTMIPGAVRIAWSAVADRDNEHLTYRVYRDSDTSTPVCETTRASEWWRLPTVACLDTSAPEGSHRYLVVASDTFGNRLSSTWTTATVGAANSGTSRPYADAVRADGATGHWSLSETGGTTAHDRVGTADMTIYSGVTPGQAGAVFGDADPSFRFNGTSTAGTATRSAVPGPQTFSLEAWFRTTTTAGGRIVGFSSAQTGLSSQFDRHVYLDTAGRLSFGVNDGSTRAITTTRTYNDGNWHHVVGTLSAAGLTFSVDGTVVGQMPTVTSAQRFNGFWRIGGDHTWNGSTWFNGQVDEVAVYPTALTAAQVDAHFSIGRTGQATNVAPSAAFTAATSDLAVSVDGSGSTDRDGQVAAYAWDFGDGATGSGATASHTYAAAGTYTVRLTVTDDDGATGTATREVTVAPAPTGTGSVAADAFERAVSSGWGSADRGGAWTMAGSSAVSSVSGGAGQLSGGIGRTVSASLGEVSRSDVAVQGDLTLVQAPTGGGAFVNFGGRRVGTSDYAATLRFQSTGVVDLRLDRTVDNVTTVLTTQRLAGTYTAGTALTVRLEIEGTALRAKAWPAGTAEPASWTVTATDSTAALQRPGALAFELYTASTATRQQVVRLDNLRAEPPGTPAEEPAENVVPTAEFTATTSGLGVSVDGSASTDTDGTVASHSWDFGDGTAPVGGATASHTYAAAGTYPVTLTVTDDDGATATRTREVTVTAPAPDPEPEPDPDPVTQPLAADAFERAVSSGWGSADHGGAWTMGGGSVVASVTGGEGQLSGGIGRGVGATLREVSLSDVAVQADLTLVQAPTGGGTFFSLGGRRTSGTDYRTTLRFQSTGTVDVRLDRVVDGATTILVSQRLAATYTAGTALTVRVEIEGTELRAKVWPAGTAEPASWTVTATDSGPALQRPGALFLEMYTSSSATRQQVIRLDDLLAQAPGTVAEEPEAPAEPEEPAENAVPTAEFTATTSDLTVAVDGSASTDTDGTVAAHSWDFGDSTPATSGATATHTYAAAGTYTVTLTVTDDDGATATRTREVTVTAPAPDPEPDPDPVVQPLAADAFERAVTSGWGSADQGGAWTMAGSSAVSSVSGGAGQLSGGIGRTVSATLGEFAQSEVAVQAELTLVEAPTGTGSFVNLGGRRVGTSDYAATLRFQSTGVVDLRLDRTVDGATTVLTTQRLAGTYTAGTALVVRMEIEGTALRAKVWAAGTAEPTAWTVTATDTTAALQAPGALAVELYTSSSATRQQVIRLDDLWAGAPGATPPAP